MHEIYSAACPAAGVPQSDGTGVQLLTQDLLTVVQSCVVNETIQGLVCLSHHCLSDVIIQ